MENKSLREHLKKTQATGNEQYFTMAEAFAPSSYNEYIEKVIGSYDGLDLLEIACGHGRITNQILSYHSPKSITLVDINPDNIEYCEDRFATVPFMKYFINNGMDLSQIESNSIDRVYSFDSMVHFNSELMTLYVSEIKRVLKKGGEAYIHFSNHGKYNSSAALGVGLRGEMTNDKMLDLVSDCEVIFNKIIDWAGAEKIDGIILFKKI